MPETSSPEHNRPFGSGATVGLAADHAGFALKTRLADFLRGQGIAVVDFGPETDARVDYPDYGRKLAAALARGDVTCGIGICGSGIGMDIALNRNSAVRAALCTSVEMARLARLHNDANALVLGGRLIDVATAEACVAAFLDTAFEGGRHAARVAKLGAGCDTGDI